MNNEQGRQSSKYAININANVSGTGSDVYVTNNEVVGAEEIFNDTSLVKDDIIVNGLLSGSS